MKSSIGSVNILMTSRVDESDGRKQRLKRSELAIKRCFTALSVTVFHRNPPYHFLHRFLAAIQPPFSLLFGIHFLGDGIW